MPKITAKLVAALEPEAGDVFVWDSELRGFGIRVYPSGAKKYLVQWKRDGRTRRFGLGSHPLLKTDAARAKALDTLARIERGEDPAEERDARKADRTVAELLDLYLAEGAGHLKAGTRETYASVFRRHVCPLLGDRKLRSLKPADIAKMIDDIGNGRTAGRIEGEAKKHGRVIVRGGRGIAARSSEYLGAVCAWAVGRGMLATNPCAGVKKPKNPTDGALSDHGRVPAARGGAGGGRGRGRQSILRGGRPAAGAHRLQEVGGHDPSVGAGRQGRRGAAAGRLQDGTACRSALAASAGHPGRRSRAPSGSTCSRATAGWSDRATSGSFGSICAAGRKSRRHTSHAAPLAGIDGGDGRSVAVPRRQGTRPFPGRDDRAVCAPRARSRPSRCRAGGPAYRRRNEGNVVPLRRGAAGMTGDVEPRDAPTSGARGHAVERTRGDGATG